MKMLAKIPTRRKEELAGLLSLALGMLLFFSLISHSPEDDFYLVGNIDISIFEVYAHNWVGLAGALLSYLLFYLMGLLAFFIPVFIVMSGLRYLFKWKLKAFRVKLYYIFAITAGVFLILSLRYVPTARQIDFMGTPGGALTVGVASFFVKFVGKIGAMVIFFTAILIMIMLVTEWRPSWLEKPSRDFPEKMKKKILGWFGILSSKNRRTAGKAMSDREDKPGLISKIQVSVSGLFSTIAGVFKKSEKRAPISRPEPASVDSADDPDGEKLTDLFEKLRSDDDADLAVATSDAPVDDEDASAKEKMMMKLSRKPEDGYNFPDLSILQDNPQVAKSIGKSELKMVADQLLETLKTFKISVVDDRIDYYPGPIVTRYEFKPAPGIKVNQVINLADDLALALQAKRIRIIAPVPGKAAIGVEIPNRYPETVYLKNILADKSFVSKKLVLPMALGLTTGGEPFVADLASMPHLLIAGSTGSGKSVCMNVIITSLIYRHHPDNLRFIFIDPKMLELSIYTGIPHLERPVITRARQAEKVLNDAVVEMENRYKKLAEKGVRNIIQFNSKVPADERLPYIVIMVDELADLMMSSHSSRIELMITRLAQMARAVGIHLILATQRPSVDVITGLIKANFSARIAFQVPTKIDSRTILDSNGAEKLLGQGDMLFLAPGQAEPARVHGAFISSEETSLLVQSIKQQEVAVEPIETMTKEATKKRTLVSESDPLLKEAAEVVIRHKQGSVSLLQRRLGIGYQRAARLIDALEEKGVVGPYDGSKAREVLVDQKYLEEINANSG